MKLSCKQNATSPTGDVVTPLCRKRSKAVWNQPFKIEALTENI
jgi:hypothetical protein